MNKYANMNKVRVEDAINIFRENIFTIINKEDYYLVGEDEDEDLNNQYCEIEIKIVIIPNKPNSVGDSNRARTIPTIN